MPLEDPFAGASGRIPQPDGAIARAGGEAPIAQQRQGVHPALMPLEDPFTGAAGRIPQPDGVVV